MPAERGQRQRYPAGAADHVGHGRGRRTRGELADQRRGGLRRQRGYRQPGRGRGAQRLLGVGRQPVRGAQADGYPTVRGQRRQRRYGQRIGPLQVVEEEQAAAYPRTDRLGEQRRVVDRQADLHGPGQRQPGRAAQHGQPAAGEHRPAEGGTEAAQDRAAAGAGRAGQDDEPGVGQPGDGVGDDLADGVCAGDGRGRPYYRRHTGRGAGIKARVRAGIKARVGAGAGVCGRADGRLDSAGRPIGQCLIGRPCAGPTGWCVSHAALPPRWHEHGILRGQDIRTVVANGA